MPKHTATYVIFGKTAVSVTVPPPRPIKVRVTVINYQLRQLDCPAIPGIVELLHPSNSIRHSTGLTDAELAGIAFATFGLVASGIIGGPIAETLIKDGGC